MRKAWLRWGAGLASLLLVLLLVPASTASADLPSELSEAESRVGSAEAELTAAQGRLEQARARRAAAARRAVEPVAAARTARARVRALRADLLETQRRARRAIAEREEDRRAAADEHDDEVSAGIGIGIAAIIVAALVLGWSRFRVSLPVVALGRVGFWQAVALCVGGGFVVAVIGAAMGSGDGPVATVGIAIFLLGVVLPVALLLARRRVGVEGERLRGWLSGGAAALLVLFGLAAILAAVLRDEPEAVSPSVRLQQEANALRSGPGAERLGEAKEEAAEARQLAAGPLARRRAAGAALRRARRRVQDVQSGLLDATAEARRLANRLEAALAREEREAIAEQRREERLTEELEEEAEEESVPAGCDDGYSGCVPPYPPDVDCSEVGESVAVYGSDPHGLDADADGIGCE